MYKNLKILPFIALGAAGLLGCQSLPKKMSATAPSVSTEAGAAVPLSNIQVVRKDATHFLISWSGGPDVLPVTIYLSPTPDSYDRQSTPWFSDKDQKEILVETPAYIVRPYFFLIPNKGSQQIAAERQLPLQGQENCGDIGGYPTQDGRFVKWGQIYRCGDLNRLTTFDLQYLSKIGIVMNIDLRTREESDKWPNKLPAEAVRTGIPITLGEFQMDDYLRALETGDLSKLGADKIIEAYSSWSENNMKDFGDFVKRMFHDSNRPMIINCTLGKDRSGMATAVILWMLGVDMDTIKQDYLLTNRYREGRVNKVVEDFQSRMQKKNGIYMTEAEVAPLRETLEARREYIEAGIDAIKKKYKTVDNFLEAGLGLTAENRRQLQESFLDGSTY